jgi:hypothetical protein
MITTDAAYYHAGLAFGLHSQISENGDARDAPSTDDRWSVVSPRARFVRQIEDA